jgi:hypothetical protein
MPARGGAGTVFNGAGSRHQDADEVGGLSFGLRPEADFKNCCWLAGSEAANAFRLSDMAAHDRPSAKVLMSSDLPLEIKRANSSALNGKASSWERRAGFPKKCFNQSANRLIGGISRPQHTTRSLRKVSGRRAKFAT